MNKLGKATIGIMGVTLGAKIIGFIKELVLSATFGTSIYSDIYIATMSIPTILLATIGTAIGTTFIPLYYENLNNNGQKQAHKFTNNMVNIVLIITISISTIAMIYAEQVVSVFAVGFKGEEFELAVQFTRIMIFGGVFMNISKIISSLLQIKGKFVLASLNAIPLNIIIIIFMITSFITDNIYLLPIGTLLGMASTYFIFYPFVRKDGFRYSTYLDLRDEYVIKTIQLVTPVIIGVMVNQVNSVIDKTIASTLETGSISALNYANKLNGFVITLFITTLVSLIYPMLSKSSIDSNKEKYHNTIDKSLKIVTILLIPISIGAIVLSVPIVELLFKRGVFDETAVKMTSIALIFYSIGIIGVGMREVLNKIFYSAQDTRTPMINGVLSMVMNIILNIILSRFMGYAGLALATSISVMICTLLQFRSLKNKVGYSGGNEVSKLGIKSLVSSCIMGIIVYLVHDVFIQLLGITVIMKLISLILSIVIGLIIYLLLMVFMNMKESKQIIHILKLKIEKRREVNI